MTNEGGFFAGLAILLGLGFLVAGKKASAAPPPPAPFPPPGNVNPPANGGPPAPPPPAPAPAPGTLADQIRSQAAAFPIPDWLALATAQTESGMRVLPSKDEGGRYGRTHYPMGIKAATVATVLGHADEWWTNPAKWEAMSDDLPYQIDAACQLLSQYYKLGTDSAAAWQGAPAVWPLDIVRIAWQAGRGGDGGADAAIRNKQLPAWYTAVQASAGTSYRQRWLRNIAQWGGPNFTALLP